MLILSIILSVLISLPSGESCAVRNLSYYVTPSSQLNRNATLDYNDEVLYKTLKEYQKQGNFSEFDYKSNGHFTNNITVIFLVGVHEAKSDKPLRFVNVEGITFVGSGHSDQVIIKNLDLIESLQVQWSYRISQWKEVT